LWQAKWNSTVTEMKETKDLRHLVNLFDNKTEYNVARGYNFMQNVHVYQTIVQSTLRYFASFYRTK